MGSGASTIEIPLPSEEKTINASSIPFPKKGVKLSYVQDFYNLCGGRDIIEDLTTTEINDNFQKKITEKYKLSFCDYLSYQNHPAVGEATVFISHAWKYRFVDVMDALQFHFKDNPDVIIWFDLFSNNQHITLDLDFNWWCGAFKSAIEMFGHTVMVFCPWNDPIPLKRTWCIWELYCTFVTKQKFEIALSHENQKQFLNDVLKAPTGEINKMLTLIDAEKSECFKPEDRSKIFEIVKKEVGFNNINSMIFEKMRDWVVTTTKSFMSIEKDDKKIIEIMSTLGTLYCDQGKYDLTEPLFVDCFKKRKELLGDDHPDTLTSMNNLAILYDNQGKNDLARPLYLDCLSKRKEILGDNHSDTLASMNNVANLYCDLGSYNLAEPLYLDCLSKRKELSGDNHPDTLASMNNLAKLYCAHWKYNLAEPLYVDCLKKRKELLGDDNPDTFDSMNNLADLYEKQGKYEYAESIRVPVKS